MSIVATFIDSKTFSINGDQTEIFMADRAVKAKCGSEYKYCLVYSVSYTPNITSVVLTENSDDLDATLESVEVGIVSAGLQSSMPTHDHSGNLGSGGPITLEGTVNHETIGGLLGGAEDDHYHLTGVQPND